MNPLVDVMRAGQPLLPLTVGQARHQAYRLRVRHGFSYPTLARLMAEYHGVPRSERYWREQCRLLGAPVSRPDNVPTHMREKVAA